MIKIKVLHGDDFEYVSLQDFINKYNQLPPPGWFAFIETIIEPAMVALSEEEVSLFLKKNNMKGFNFLKLRSFYTRIGKTKYITLFPDDILKYVSFIYARDYFEIINYPICEESIDLDDWLKTKGVFMSVALKSSFDEEELYSILDLLPLVNGMNAIRDYLLQASRYIY